MEDRHCLVSGLVGVETTVVLLRLDLDLDNGNIGRSLLVKEELVLDVFNAARSSDSIPM